ncbi:hypothetical protein [Streptomyces parvulus]|uniref:hypothetical protein n=1 Tax=Streptomyces parvulus TaxID=146923 RepID=UPI0037F21DB8
MTTQENRAATPDRIAAGHVVTGRERSLAIQRWLLAAADDEQKAREQWQREGVAVLKCGESFEAVRVPLVIVENAAGDARRIMLAAYLYEALLGGPVFINGASNFVYCLVAPGTAKNWRAPDTYCLTGDIYLGMPALSAPGDAASCWLIEPDGPGEVCLPDAVKQMVDFGRYRAAMRAGA